MKFALILVALLANFSQVIGASVVSKEIPPSDFEVGIIGPEDDILTAITTPHPPNTDANVTRILVGASHPNYLFSYISATQVDAQFSDARSELVEGGPGHSHFTAALYPGPVSGGFIYVVRGFGRILPGNDSDPLTTSDYEEFKIVQFD